MRIVDTIEDIIARRGAEAESVADRDAGARELAELDRLKARGLLAQILSMSENWGLSVSGMLSFQKLDGEDSVRAACTQL